MTSERAFCRKCRYYGKWRDSLWEAQDDLRAHIKKKHPELSKSRVRKAANTVETINKTFLHTFRIVS